MFESGQTIFVPSLVNIVLFVRKLQRKGWNPPHSLVLPSSQKAPKNLSYNRASSLKS